VELPRLEPLYQKYRNRGLSIIAIERTGNRKGAEKFITDNNLTYSFLENGEGDQEVVRSLFGVSSFPTTFLADENGKILFAHLDFEEGDENKIEKEILTLLK
jgi:peroxiredoxin